MSTIQPHSWCHVGDDNLTRVMLRSVNNRHNGDADDDDDTARWYIRQVEGEEVSRATAAVDQRVGG
jgi:hypothetical protein